VRERWTEACPLPFSRWRRNASGTYRFLDPRLRLPEDFRGTFAPFLRASLSAIAIACLRLLTVCPEPLLSVPFFRRRIVDFTFFDAAFP
jgi:hypothetical protein